MAETVDAKVKQALDALRERPEALEGSMPPMRAPWPRSRSISASSSMPRPLGKSPP